MTPVEVHERVDQMAPHGSCAESVGKLREVEEPVGIPGGPIRIVSVRDPIHDVVGLGRLVQKSRNATSTVVHGHSVQG